jgi:hypothetical protein
METIDLNIPFKRINRDIPELYYLQKNIVDNIIKYGKVGININHLILLDIEILKNHVYHILNELFIRNIIITGKSLEEACMFGIDISSFTHKQMEKEYGVFKVNVNNNKIEIFDCTSVSICSHCKLKTISNNTNLINISDLNGIVIDSNLCSFITPTKLRLANILNNIFYKLTKELNYDTIYTIYEPKPIVFKVNNCLYCRKNI